MTLRPIARIMVWLGAAAVAAAVAGCSGGGGSGSGSGSGGSSGAGNGGADGGPVAGIDGGGLTAQGPITRFGSIFVNGVEYSTSGANVVIAGSAADETALRIGQVVKVTATAAPQGGLPAAKEVRYEPTIEGPVQSGDPDGEQVVVAGLAVHIVATTSFGDGVANAAALQAGDFVEVSGYEDADGAVIASRIERTAVGEVEVRGTVRDLDSAAHVFSIGTLRVDYSAASSIDGFPSGAPADGDFVEAAGALTGSTLAAARLLRDSANLDGDEGDAAELEGVVTAFVSTADFSVGAQRVITTAQTQFDDGAAGDLGLGSIVEVEGKLDASGAIAASRVEFRHQGELQLEGTVASIGAAQQTFELLGRSVTVNALTRFEDDTGIAPRFSLATLAVGDFLEVRAYESGGLTVATRVTRKSLEDEVDLRGTIDALALPRFTLLGQAIETSAATRFRSVSGEDIDQVTFFAQAAVGVHTARVKGTPVQGTATIEATEVRLED